MIGIYLRVSTGRQDVEVQRQHIDEYCTKNKIDSYTIYEDVISGASKKRPAYDKMKRAIEMGEIKKVISYKIDRFGRRAVDLVEDMIFFFRLGCDVIFTSQPQLSLSHDDPFSLTKISIFAELAEMERRHISERTKLGMKKAMERDPSLGKKKDLKKRAAIAELLRQGTTQNEIAKRLSCSYSTVVDVRRNL